VVTVYILLILFSAGAGARIFFEQPRPRLAFPLDRLGAGVGGMPFP